MKFILLDQKSDREGPALVVRRFTAAECSSDKVSFHQSHVALKKQTSSPSKSDKKRKVIDVEDVKGQIEDHTYIDLEHVYNIPFAKYDCVDLGVLPIPSLLELRQHYVSWLRHNWSIT